METAKEVINDALEELTVQAVEQSIESVDFNRAARYLNRMMATFEADGITLGYIDIDSPNDEITIPDGAIEGLIFNLAKRLATAYSVVVKPELAEKAKEGKRIMRKIANEIKPTSLPNTLPLGSGNETNIYGTFFNGIED